MPSFARETWSGCWSAFSGDGAPKSHGWGRCGLRSVHEHHVTWWHTGKSSVLA